MKQQIGPNGHWKNNPNWNSSLHRWYSVNCFDNRDGDRVLTLGLTDNKEPRGNLAFGAVRSKRGGLSSSSSRVHPTFSLLSSFLEDNVEVVSGLIVSSVYYPERWASHGLHRLSLVLPPPLHRFSPDRHPPPRPAPYSAPPS